MIRRMIIYAYCVYRWRLLLKLCSQSNVNNFLSFLFLSPFRVLLIRHRSIFCYNSSSISKKSCLISSNNLSIIWSHPFPIFCFRKAIKAVHFASSIRRRNIPTHRVTHLLELKKNSRQIYFFQRSLTSRKNLLSRQIHTHLRIRAASNKNTIWSSSHRRQKNSDFWVSGRVVIQLCQTLLRDIHTKVSIFNDRKHPLTTTPIQSCPAFKKHIPSSTIN